MNILVYTNRSNHDLLINLSVPNINIFIINKEDLIYESIKSIITKNKINVIIPVHYQQAKCIIELNGFISSTIKLICPTNYKIMETFINKINFIEFMMVNKLDKYIPTVYSTHNKIYNNVNAPYIFKLAQSFAGYGSFICHNNSYVDAIRKMNFGKQYILQEYIQGHEEYSAHLFIDQGKIKWSRCYKMTNEHEFFIQKGHMNSYEKINDIDYSIFETIFSLVNYTGMACIDFKYKDGVIKIFEINPRFGGSLLRNHDDLCDLIKFICNS